MTARDPIADLNERIKAKAAFNAAAELTVRVGADQALERVSHAGGEQGGEISARRAAPNSSAPAAAPSKYHDECDSVTWLVETYFNSSPDACERCVYFRELSETCEALEDGMAECCPQLDRLIEENIREMRDAHEAGVP